MADIKFLNEYCIIINKDTDELILAEKMTGRVEALHKVYKYLKLEDVPIEQIDKLPKAVAENLKEGKKLFNVDGKVKEGELIENIIEEI